MQVVRAFQSLQAEFPSVEMWLVPEPADVDVMLDIPRQPGLSFPINLNLQGDELQLSAGSYFHVEWFPCTDPKRQAGFFDAVRGLISGRYRIVEYHRGTEVDKAVLQRPSDKGWKTFATWGWIVGVWFSWRAKRVILQNTPLTR